MSFSGMANRAADKASTNLVDSDALTVTVMVA